MEQKFIDYDSKTIPRNFTKPANYQGLDYPVAGRVENMFSGNLYVEGAQPPYFSASKVKANQYKIIEFHWKEEPTQSFSSLYKATLIRSSVAPTGVEMYPNKPIYYYATNRRVTENFVDKSGAKSRHLKDLRKGIKSQSPVILLLILLQKLYQAFMRLGQNL